MANAKFSSGEKVRVTIKGKTRLGRVQAAIPSTRTGRRLYNVVAESNGSLLGSFRSDEIIAR